MAGAWGWRDKRFHTLAPHGPIYSRTAPALILILVVKSVKLFCFFCPFLHRFNVCFRDLLLGNFFMCASRKAALVSIQKTHHMVVW